MQVGVLAAAEDLDALPGEGLVEAREREARPVEVGRGDLPRQALAAADAAEVEGVLLLEVEVEEIEDRELSSRPWPRGA